MLYTTFRLAHRVGAYITFYEKIAQELINKIARILKREIGEELMGIIESNLDAVELQTQIADFAESLRR